MNGFLKFLLITILLLSSFLFAENTTIHFAHSSKENLKFSQQSDQFKVVKEKFEQVKSASSFYKTNVAEAQIDSIVFYSDNSNSQKNRLNIPMMQMIINCQQNI